MCMLHVLITVEFILAVALGGSTCVAQNCTAPATWFPHSQTPEPDAAAFPANATNCDFHQWGWQEFLWLTQSAGPERLRFMDFKTPNDLLLSKPLAAAAIPRGRVLRLLPRFAKSSGPTEPGSIQQAFGGVLVDQSQRAVYYATFINDTFYSFVQTNGYNEPAKYAAVPRNTDFPVGSVELKSAWKIVGDSGSTPPPGFFSTVAQVPPLIEITDSTGQKVIAADMKATPLSVRVVLVGLHVVGVVANHPEFIWATFEQNANAPILADVPSANNFTFYAANTAANLCNVPNQVPGQSTTLTLNPATQQLTPVTNVFLQVPMGGGSAQNIANITSLNASVKSQLASTDVFFQYSLIGAIWLFPNALGGTPTTPGSVFQNPSVLAGSLQLSNSTMETFAQPGMCFGCHNTSGDTKGAITIPATNMNLSHVMLDTYYQNSVKELIAKSAAVKAAAAPAP